MIPVKHPPDAYGPRLPFGSERRCKGCGRAIDPAERAHVCRACRVRKCRGAELGSACALCGLADRRMLRRVRLAEGPATLCGNHAALLGRRTISIEMLRAEAVTPAPGDRRRGVDRRMISLPIAVDRRRVA
jgi:hypothetical protein